jgi:carbon-monoxide dehydrogenase small subunit
LIHYLRDVAGLTGSHIGCETSLCGACTVELDGKAVKSLQHVRGAGGRREPDYHRRLAENGKLHGMQEAFWNQHGATVRFLSRRQ